MRPARSAPAPWVKLERVREVARKPLWVVLPLAAGTFWRMGQQREP